MGDDNELKFSDTINFKRRKGRLTSEELLDALTEVVNHQSDINIALINILIAIKSDKDKDFDLNKLLRESGELVNLNRILIDRYLEIRRGD